MKKLNTAFVWALLLVVVMFFAWNRQSQSPAVPYAQFQADVAEENVAGIVTDGKTLTVTTRQGELYTTRGVLDATIFEKLSEQAAKIATSCTSASIALSMPSALGTRTETVVLDLDFVNSGTTI